MSADKKIDEAENARDTDKAEKKIDKDSNATGDINKIENGPSLNTTSDELQIDDGEKKKGTRNRLILISVAAIIIVSSTAVGVALWPTTKVSEMRSEERVQLEMPLKTKSSIDPTASLNTLGSDESDNAAGSLNTLGSDESENAAGSLNTLGSDESDNAAGSLNTLGSDESDNAAGSLNTLGSDESDNAAGSLNTLGSDESENTAGSLNTLGSDESDNAAGSLNTLGSDESDNAAGSLNTLGSDESDNAAGALNNSGQEAENADEGGGSLNAMSGLPSGNSQGLVIPSVTAASFRKARKLQKAAPLVTAPSKAMLETVKGLSNPLPMIDKKGRKPWEVYARPLTGNEKGRRIAIMVFGLGLSRAASMAAIRKLPPEVSLVFEPYANNLKDWLLRSRMAGHEVFVSLPMESNQFPIKDPGPLALTTSVQASENLRRLHTVLSSFGGYVGVVSTMGSKFSTADAQLKPILLEIKNRGLMYVDATSISTSSAPTIAAEIGLPVVKSKLILDNPPSSENIQKRLTQLERAASKNAAAIAVVRPFPVSIVEIQSWVKTLNEKNLALVPVSSFVKKDD